MPRIAEPVTLSKEQKEALQGLVSRRTTAQGPHPPTKSLMP